MKVAFDPQLAQFDGIHAPPPRLWLSKIVHRAFVEVNEEGTEAVTVTDGTVCFSSEKPSILDKFEMIVDRPFCLFIWDETTHTMLFMGAVERPGD
jgi:serine protease inhibitor